MPISVKTDPDGEGSNKRIKTEQQQSKGPKPEMSISGAEETRSSFINCQEGPKPEMAKSSASLRRDGPYPERTESSAHSHGPNPERAFSGPETTKSFMMTPNNDFQKFIDEESPFTIFRFVRDLGFHGWNPCFESSGYIELSDVARVDITSRISTTSKPRTVVDPKTLATLSNIPFINGLSPQSHWNKFPYNPSHSATVHVAAVEKKVDMDQVDFVFGGSVLNVLATQEIQPLQYLATRVPGTKKTILVARHDAYENDYSVPGYQFERLMTGRRMEDKHDEETITHMQIMEVCGYKVLFSADSDALDASGNPVKLTTKKQRYWKLKILFQMISCGSLSIFAGTKSRVSPFETAEKLSNIHVETIKELSERSLSGFNLKLLEENMARNMKMIRNEVLDHDKSCPNTVFELCPAVHPASKNSLTLSVYTGESQFLPPASVMKELLQA